MILADIPTTSLHEAMGTFYDDSSIPMTDTPTYTMPYKDFFTNGMNNHYHISKLGLFLTPIMRIFFTLIDPKSKTNVIVF